MHKNALFLLKNCKNRPGLGDTPPDPWCPPAALPPHHWEILAMPLPVSQIHIYRKYQIPYQIRRFTFIVCSYS